jgi:hypothetical protein
MSYFVTTIGIARLWPRSTVHANTLVALESTTMSDLIPEAFSYALLRFVCKLSNCVVGLAALKMSLMEPSCFKNNLRACSSEDACATSSPELDGDEGDGDRCISGPESRCNRDSIFILPFELFNHLELEKEWHLHRASSHLQQEQGAKSARARPSLSQVNHNHGTGSPWIHTRRSHAKKMMEKINLIPPKGRRLPVGEGAAGSLRWRRGCISALRKLQ